VIKSKASIYNDWNNVYTDLMLAGQDCGSNPICHKYAKYGHHVTHKIDDIVIKKWVDEIYYGS